MIKLKKLAETETANRAKYYQEVIDECKYFDEFVKNN